MDLAYLDRLADAVKPDGDMVTRVFRFSDDPDTPPDVVGQVAIWQVEMRGDDALELIRLARLGLAAVPSA